MRARHIVVTLAATVSIVVPAAVAAASSTDDLSLPISTAAAAPEPESLLTSAGSEPVQHKIAPPSSSPNSLVAGVTSSSASPTPGPTAAPSSGPATTSPPRAATAATTIDAKALPLLDRPVLVSPLTRELTPSVPGITLDVTRDYIIKVKAGSVFRTGITLLGGHNVVFEAATVQFDPTMAGTGDLMARALMLKGQTGVMYINGLTIRGPLKEGIQMEEKSPGVAVVLKNINIVEPIVGGSYEGWHSDLLQTWAGPSRLVIDGFTGASDYQGFFLKPNQLWLDGPKPEFMWMRNVNLDICKGYYALWTDGGVFPVQTTNVVIKANSADRNRWLYPQPSTGDTTWSTVIGTL